MGIPWNDHHTTGFPDTDVQSGVKTGLPDIVDRIADRTCSISDRCRISA